MRRYLILLTFLICVCGHSQTAPAHLRYFGYALIDVFWDDPLDSLPVTNYLTEVDTFSNLAHLAVYSPSDNIVARVTNMNSHCVLPMLHIQEILFEYEDTAGPSGANYRLRSDYLIRWNQFVSINQQCINTNSIGAFYIADEPYWNGITYAELDTVCSMLQASYPGIPVFLVEAYTMMNQFQVPPDADWLAFDMYGIFDPPNDPQFMSNLTLLKNARTSSSQELFLIIDDQWLPIYGQAGYAPDTIEHMVQNYYNLAVADTAITGLLGYLWAGGFDDPAQLGVRNMPVNVIQKNVSIGSMIKSNFNPCAATTIEEPSPISKQVYPNPVGEVLHVKQSGVSTSIKLYNSLGLLAAEYPCSGDCTVDVSELPCGIYFLVLENLSGVSAEKIFISR